MTKLPSDLLVTERINLDCPAASKKRALEKLAELLAGGDSTTVAETIFGRLVERERLGSTGMVDGIALPHARIKGVTVCRGAFVHLREAIDFDSIDDKPADLIFALLVPENATQQHLDLLAKLAEFFSNKVNTDAIRSASTPQEVLNIFNGEFNNAGPDNTQGSIRVSA